MNVKGQHWVIMGLGKSGRAAACLLAGRGARCSLWDRKKDPEHQAFAETLGDALAGYFFGMNLPPGSFDGGIISPGIPLDHPDARTLASQCQEWIGEIELAWRFWNGQTVAITGTNGKSTTTELTAAILKGADRQAVACGNLGIPFAEVVLKHPEEKIAVVEVSSFQLETIVDFHPEVATYLNLAADHLDRYPSIEAYGKAKENIFRNQSAEDLAIAQKELGLGGLSARLETFSTTKNDADWYLRSGWVEYQGKPLLEYAGYPLAGDHNADARHFGVSAEEAAPAIRNFGPLPHRCEIVDEWENLIFVNDSKATNPDAMARAVQGAEGPIALIAGGRNKGFDFRPLAGIVGESCRHVILMGESADELEASWGDWVNCIRVNSMEEAVQVAFAKKEEIRTVLLSPGCASFDMFDNFEQRGERFREAVQKQKTSNKE